MPLFIDDTPIKATTPTKDVVNVLRNANLGIENIGWYSDSLLAFDTCTAEGESDAFWVSFETPENESDSPRTLLYIDDDDEVYENQEVDTEATYKRIGRKILEALAKL
jgi:hypothetical protein